MPQKLNKRQREAATIALSANGLTQVKIAEELGIDRKTVARYLEESKPAEEVVRAAVVELNEQIAKFVTVEQRAQKYAALAKEAKNEAVSLGALQRIDDLAGIVTQKELVRTRRDEVSQPQAMFMMAPGTTVNVSVTPKQCINMQVEGDNATESE